MKKFSLLMMTLVAAATMSATVVTFDFSNPTSMGLTPSSKVSDGVLLNSDTITVGNVAMSFSNTTGNGAKLWTAAGPTYSLRLYQPSKMILTSSGDNIRGVRVTRSQGDITELDEKNEWRGDAKSVTLSVPEKGKANYISMVTVYVGEEMPTTKIDTISVSEALKRIDDKNLIPCYVKGVVMSAPFVLNDRKCVWLTDINNPGDSIEGYGIRKGKASKETYPSLDSMAVDFGLQDTVLVYADALAKYNAVYEVAGGYFVETLGKSQAIDASETFPHAFGAVQMEQVEGSYRYEIVLSKEEDNYDNALHYVIRTAKEKGIVGTYSTYKDSSFVDGEGPVSGSLSIAFVRENATDNTYAINGNFIAGGKLYRFDKAQYDLAGYPGKDIDKPFKLEDDVPYKPKDGDTLTCEQALSYAKGLDGTTSELTVWVRGFVNGNDKSVKGRTQQSIYMADEKGAKDSQFTGYLCYTQNLDSIIADDEVLVKGNIKYYAAKQMAEIEKGKIYRIGGSSTQRPRNPELKSRPADAISVTQALAIGAALKADSAQTVETTETYTVAGYIVDVNYQMSKDTASWYMADNKGEFGEFKAYKCQIKSLICEGDEVFVTGKISKYMKSSTEASISISKGAAEFISLSSGIEEIVAATKEINSKKLIINGQLYIVQDGILYNAQGNAVR